MYSVDWSNVLRGACPPRLFKKTIVAWLSVLIGPVQMLHARFMDYTVDINYKLTHSGQVCYLEGALNDEFDPVLRRLYVADAGGSVIVPLQRDSDNDPVVLGPDSGGPYIMLQPDSGYSGGNFDFIVVIPYAFSQADRYRLRSLVDYYKLAGKRYDIIIA